MRTYAVQGPIDRTDRLKERPILFSTPMVRAILDGRKTVTRRSCKPQPSPQAHVTSADGNPMRSWRETGKKIQLCPYGQPGDRLWVRETWGVISHDFDQQGNAIDWEPDRPAKAIREMRFGRGYYSGHAVYAADGPCEWAGDEDGGGDPRSAWKPSIHMPRVASRILLEITEVRVEQLQAISIGQICKEGLARSIYEFIPVTTAFDAFAKVWDSINGPGAWAANPWVWAIEFKRIEP